MTGQIKLTGMVLVSMPVGDYDRRLTILTKERGKISAFAKGARKPTSALLGLSQPFAFGDFVLFEGKSSYNVVGAEISNYFAELRDDMSAIYYAMYFCEFCTYMTKENMEAGGNRTRQCQGHTPRYMPPGPYTTAKPILTEYSS